MADEDLSYLSFLDDTQSQGRSDLSYLSFLSEPEVSDKTASQGFQGSGRYPQSLEGPQPRRRTIADSFQGGAPFPEELAGPQKPKPIPEPTEPIQDYPRPLEKKSLLKMTGDQVMDFLKRAEKAHLQVGKGFASGATLSATELTEAGKPKDKDLLFRFGEAIGTFVPASLLSSMYGGPLLSMAAKSPKYVAGLQALARMTGMGLTGPTIKAGRELIQGEVPKPKELAKEAALWFALDGGLQAIGLANQFRQSVNRIAEQEGISNKEVLSQLWQATKNYTRQKFNRAIGRPETIRPDDIETLAQIADQRAIQPGETIDITPEPPPKPKQITTPPSKPELEQLPEKPVIEKPKREPRPAKVTETPAVIEAEAPKTKVEPIETTKAGEDEYRYFDPKKDFDVSKIQKLNEREYADHIKLAESQSPEVAKEVRKRAKLLYDLIDDYSVDRHDKKVVDLFSLEKKMEFLRDGIAREIMNEGNVKPTLQDLIDRMKAAGESPIKPIEAPAKEVAPDKPKAIEKPKVEAKPEPKPTGPISTPPIAEGAKKAQRNAISPKELKEQKAYFLKKLADALKKPPKGKHIDISIPGDGDFKIINTPEAIKEAIKRVQAKFPTAPLKPPKYEHAKPKPTGKMPVSDPTVSDKMPEPKIKRFDIKLNEKRGVKEKSVTGLVYDDLFGIYTDKEQTRIYHIPTGLSIVAFKEKSGALKMMPYIYAGIIDKEAILDSNPYKESKGLDADLINEAYNAIRNNEPLPKLIRPKPEAKPTDAPKAKKPAVKPKADKPKPKAKAKPETKPKELDDAPDVEPVYVPAAFPPDYLISTDNLKISRTAPEGKTKSFTALTFTGPQNNLQRVYLKKTGLVYDDIFAIYEHDGKYIVEHMPSRSEYSSHLAEFKTLEQAKAYMPYIYKSILPGVDATKPASSARFDLFDGYFLDDVKKKILKGQPLPSLENIEPKPFEHYYEEGEAADDLDVFYRKKPKKSADTLASRISTKERKPKMGKGQTIAKQKMVQVLRDVFKDPIRIGKIRQRKALGIHKLWSRVSRLLYHNDLETAAHEIGHNLHGILYGGSAKNAKQFRQNAINALRPYLDELKPIAGYEPHELEGFAEFVRMYVTNPETIKALAPKFYDVFEAEMQAREPELLKGLLTVRGYYEDWINASPEARVEAQIDFDKETVTERVKKLYESGLVDKAVHHMIDEYRPAQRVEALIYGLPIHEIEELGKPSLYRALRLLKNSPLNIEQYLYHGTFDPVTKETTGEPLTKILQEIRTNKEWREFNNYLVSERVLELAKRDIQKGVSIADALATVKKYSKYKPLAKRFRAWIDRTLDYAVKSELVKPEAAEAMRKAGLFYVPLQVEKPGSKAFAGLKKLQAKVPFFRIKGSRKRIVPPVEGAIKNLYQIITNADKNRVGLVLSKLAQEKGAGLYIEKVPAPMKMVGMVKTPEIEAAIIKHLIETGNTEFLIETDGKFALDPAIADILPETIMRFRPGSYKNNENIVTVFEGGKPQYYEVIPELYQMWSGVMDPQSAHFLLKMISPVTKLKRMSATLNIPFAVNNLIRDSWERLMYSRFPPNPRDVRDVAEHIFLPLKMLFDVAGHSELYNKYIRSGGGLSTLVSMDKTSLQTTAMEVRKGRHITMRKLFSPKYVVYLIRRMVEIGEEANKLAEFYRGLKEYGDTVLGRERAAFSARDLSIDHNRAGITGRGINQQTAFFNAGVQGGNKFYRRMRDPKTRAKTLFGMFAFVSVPSALAYLTVYDDDDYKELSAAERDRNLIFKAGGKFVKIPVPFEPGIIANGLVRRSLEWMRTHDPEAFRGFAHSLFEGMLPPMLPDVAHAPLEIAANRDFFRDAPIIPKAKEGLLAREQYKESTSLTARLLGRWLSYLPGVDPQSKVASPAVIDHLILSYATRWGQLALGIFDKGVSASGAIDPGARPSRPITDQMGLNLFTIRYPRANTQSIQDFYETYAEIQALRKTKSFYEGEGRQDDADEMRKALDDKGNPHRFDIAYKALQTQQALINRTYTDPGMDDEQKQAYIDEMYLQKIAIAREMIKEMKEWKKQQQKD